MQILETIVIIVEALCSLALILVVLFQSGKESGLSGALAGTSNSYLSKNKNSSLDKVLANSTKWLALAWILLTLSLSFFK